MPAAQEATAPGVSATSPRAPTARPDAIQELLGHADVSTTMIYTHVLDRGPLGVTSPADKL